ncbi:MAG: HAMP domain-containing histidine kinase [Marinifilaceae bacterium]|jgi:signal transduction histidine kinase|nr:HAMP domain-containing histidine kinase [Marinifilaceae bacterium]
MKLKKALFLIVFFMSLLINLNVFCLTKEYNQEKIQLELTKKDELKSFLNICKKSIDESPFDAIILAKRCEKISRFNNFHKENCLSLFYIAKAHRISNLDLDGLDYGLKAYRKAIITKNNELVPYISLELSIIFSKIKRNKEAILFAEKSLKEFKKRQDTISIIKTYKKIGDFHNSFNQEDRAINYYETSLNLANEIKSYDDAIVSNLCIANIYMNQNDYTKARIYITNTEKDLSHSLSTKTKNLLSLYNLKYKTGINKLKESEILISQLKDLSDNMQFNDFYAELYQIEANYYSIIEDYKLSNLYLNKHLRIIKANHNNTNIQITDSLLDYHNRWEDSYFNLQVKPSKSLHNIYINRTYAIITILLLSLCLAIIWLLIRYRNKAKNIEILALKNTLAQERHQKMLRTVSKIKQKEKKLLSSNIAKDKMFSLIAHDLRGAVGNISNGLRMLVVDNDLQLSQKERYDFLESIFHASNNAFELLENLLVWSKNQSDELKAKFEEFDLETIVDSNLDLHCDIASLKFINLVKDIDAKYKVYGDSNMINTVIRNLISNAIKFTQKGGKICIKCTEINNMISINIIDDGVGMTPEQIKKIEYGYTTNGTNNEKGSGLGLSLINEFLEINKSKLEISSEAGKGSCFSFELPKSGLSIKNAISELEVLSDVEAVY